MAERPPNFGESLTVNDVAVLLLGVALGWLIMFAVRRNRVHWGAFATFLSVIMGSTAVKFFYAQDLLAWYGIGLFVGVFTNTVVRGIGAVLGGRAGEGLLEIAAFSPKAAGDVDDGGPGPEGQGPA